MIDTEGGTASLTPQSNGSWVFSGFNNSELAKLQEKPGNRNARTFSFYTI